MSKKWIPDDNARQARRIGKTLEELGELTAVVARISIQGMDEIDPASGETNRVRLHKETADVIAQLQCNIEAFGMDEELISMRVEEKMEKMHAWELHFS